MQWLVESWQLRLVLTLLHFVWQGALVALALRVLVPLLARRDPQTRYLLSLTAMVVLALFPLVTFVALEVSSAAGQVELGALVHQDAVAQAGPLGQRSPHTGADDIPLLARWQKIVLSIWFGGAMVFGGRLVIGSLATFQLRRCRSELPAAWGPVVRELQQRLALAGQVQLCVCQQIQQALVTGLVRPLILLPASWVTEMPPPMLEAIIAHELAHVRRWDLWVNLLQRTLETLFFYHPAVWWLSHRLRVERELCCDQLAVAVLGDPINYVEALELVARRRFAEQQLALATAFRGGRNMRLLERVNNVLAPSSDRSRFWPAGVLALLLPLAFWTLGTVTPPLAPSLAVAQEEERDERREERSQRADEDEDENNQEERAERRGRRQQEERRSRERQRQAEERESREEREDEGRDRRSDEDRLERARRFYYYFQTEEPEDRREDQRGEREGERRAWRWRELGPPEAPRSPERPPQLEERLFGFGPERRGPGPGGPPRRDLPPELAEVIGDLRNELEQLRREVEQLRRGPAEPQDPASVTPRRFGPGPASREAFEARVQEHREQARQQQELALQHAREAQQRRQEALQRQLEEMREQLARAQREREEAVRRMQEVIERVEAEARKREDVRQRHEQELREQQENREQEHGEQEGRNQHERREDTSKAYDRLLSLMLEEKSLAQDHGLGHPKMREIQEQIEVMRNFLEQPKRRAAPGQQEVEANKLEPQPKP